MSEVKIRVRYEETDKMGVVYHGKYFVWLEIGRTEIFRQHGLPYTILEENEIYIPVTEAKCQYKTGATYDDELIVKTEIIKTTGVRIQFSYEVINSSGQLVATGETTHAFVNKEGRPINIKKVPWLWDKMQSIPGVS